MQRLMNVKRSSRLFSVIAFAGYIGCDAVPGPENDDLVHWMPGDQKESESGDDRPSMTEIEQSGSAVNLPCEVDRALELKCRNCHGAEPRFGAPMPLASYEDTQATAKSDPTKKVF